MSISTDFRYALRRLLQAPGYSLAVVLMLALGIAISTTLFAVLSGVLGSLPFPQSEQLVVVESRSPERGVSSSGLTPAEARRLEQPDSPFASMAYFNWGGMTVFAEERPREFNIAVVNTGFFATFGVQPFLGRWFEPEDHASERGALILSHAEWQRLLGGRADAIGEIIETSEGGMQVVGVMPPEFAVPTSSIGAWRPLLNSTFDRSEPWIWNARYLDAYARLDPQVDATQRAQRLDQISAELMRTHSLAEPRWGLGDRPLLDSIVGSLHGVLWGVFGVALLVMLVACANVAILIDARQIQLRHQQAVAQALGATRSRLYRGLLLEIGLLTALALALGGLLSTLSVDALRELARGSLPRVDAIAIDTRVWLFALGLGLLVPLIAACVGALRLQAQAMEAMRAGRAVLGRRTARAWLPAVGVALSTAGVVAGGALLVSLWQLQSVDPGLRHQGVYALQLFHRGDEDTLRDFAQRLTERLESLPGVQQVALASAAPLSIIGNFSADLKLPERDQPEPFQIRIRQVSPNYMALMRQPLLEGRGIVDGDRAGSEPVTVINQTLSRQLFGDASALGRVIELPLGQSERVAYRVVGVAGDIRNRGLRASPGPELLIPYAIAPTAVMTHLLYAPNGLVNHEKLLTDALYQVDPREASTQIYALSDAFDGELAQARFFARTVSVAALSALLLAAFGVYAVAALRQRQRVSEFGLRLAVGAAPRALALQSLKESTRVAALGIAIGLLGAWAVLRVLSAQLFGLEGIQPLVIGAAVLLLALATVLAALAPALRAARTDAMSALRES